MRGPGMMMSSHSAFATYPLLIPTTTPEEKRRNALQERRYARERRIEESIGVWEREIVPDWTVVQRNAHLRRLWWHGIPTKLRASMWQSAIGNPLALGKGASPCERGMDTGG